MGTARKCARVLYESGQYTVETLFPVVDGNSRLDQQIETLTMFNALKHELTQDQLVRLLTIDHQENTTLAILTQSNINLTNVDITTVLMWSAPPVVKALLAHVTFDPAQYDNKPLKQLVRFGAGDSLNLWLQDPRVTVTDNVLIKTNHTVINKLLKHSSVTPERYNKFTYANNRSCSHNTCSSDAMFDPFACLQ